MDLGLGNLIGLKRRLLPATMLAQTTYDTTITQIGRGVAGLFDRHCNRAFARSAAAVDQFSADRFTYVASRFPIESITSVEQRDTIAGGWVALAVNEVIYNRDDAAGLLHFGGTLGNYLSQVRLTYAGGYWFDTAETDDTAQPAGATLLPHDVREAWYLQCQEIWDKRDKLGISIIAKPEVESKVGTIEMIPAVKQLLRNHVRMQIT